ncbi:hypothetical protein DFH06DRAFT_250399 [Mycena polygramma]|nr:hypothetical protein DFH06DRAFT_322065 [Mycena polygramma]KAJ7666701.1 hypothetical protein DFH06DRAFT_250399 [Mycena polygramma]
MSVEELQARIDKYEVDIKGLENRKRATQRQLNAIRDPVARLPVELSSEIFLHCLPQQRKPDSCTAPMLLLSVCNTWTDIVLSTPALWSTIYLDFPGADILKAWLQRARSYPLSIHLHRSLDHSVATVLNQYATRLRSLEIHEEALDASVVENLGTFPRLQVLTVGSLVDEDEFEDDDDDVVVNHLTISTGILRMAPNLVQCTIRGAELYPDSYSGGQLILPSLRCLKVGDNITNLCHFDDDDDILRHVSLPALETLFLSLSRITGTDFLRFLERSLPPLQRLVLGQGCMFLDFIELDRCLRVVPSLKELELVGKATLFLEDFLSALAVDELSQFLPNLRSLRIQQFKYSDTERAASYQTVLRALSARRQLVSFTYQTEYGAPDEPGPDIHAALRQLVEHGMEIYIGTRARNFISR